MKLLRFLTNLFQKQKPTEDELDMACYFALEGAFYQFPEDSAWALAVDEKTGRLMVYDEATGSWK